MFVLRAFFWLSMVVLLLPPSEDGSEPAPRLSLLNTAYAVQALLQDVTGVCERNPGACEASRQAMALLSRKLETGAGIVVASVKAGQALSEPSAEMVDHGTLTEADLEPVWSVADAAN